MRKALIVSSFLAVACSEIESEDVQTSGMYARFEANAWGDGVTHASAVLKAGGSGSTTYVSLTGDDRLTVTAGGNELQLDEGSLGAFHSYDAELPTDAAGTEITWSFQRGDGTNAPNSGCTLPDVSVVLQPLAGATFDPAADDLMVQWSTQSDGAAVSVSVSGSCIEGWDETMGSDYGSVVIAAGALVESDETETSCEVTVEVTRTKAGQVDAAFEEGGEASCAQTRSVTVTASL